MSGFRVMVVNDEPVQLRQVARVLGEGGHEVAAFASSVAALEALAGGASVDLFVLDLHMPSIDGWKMCRLLRSPEFEAHNLTPILILSATYAGEDVVSLSRALGADGFLEAPYENQELLDAAAALLGGGEAERTAAALVIEDDASVRRAMARAFAGHGYRVLEAESVAAGRERWSEANPDIVLLDHHLPDGTSDVLLRELASVRRRTAVVVMTGDADPLLPVRLFALGADGYLRKPFDPEHAVEQARSVARQRALLRIGSVLRTRHDEEQASERRLHQSRRLESLGLMAGGVAHEFNNILVGILGNADLAALDVPAGSTALSSLEQIGHLARRAAERTRQILAFTGNARLEVEDVDVDRVVARAVRTLPSAQAARVAVVVRGPIPRVRGDSERLNEVASSLVANALEALPPGAGGVRVTVAPRKVAEGEAVASEGGAPVQPGSYVALEVTDDGCGMDEATRSRMFDPFFSTKFTGRGLGLAAVLGIVRGHGGAVTVRTAPREGTTVTVFLPAPRR